MKRVALRLPTLHGSVRSLSPSFSSLLAPSPSLFSLAIASALLRTLHRVYERTSLNKLLFIRPVAEMNLRDSYRTRPDMHDGFESLSFPPNVFSEVIDRRMNAPRNTLCGSLIGELAKNKQAGKNEPGTRSRAPRSSPRFPYARRLATNDRVKISPRRRENEGKIVEFLVASPSSYLIRRPCIRTFYVIYANVRLRKRKKKREEETGRRKSERQIETEIDR